MTYYYYPVSNCGGSCVLIAGYIESLDGGQTWSAAKQIGGRMQLNWLPNTFSGRMVADYVATVFASGRGWPMFSLAYPQITLLYPFRQAIYTVRGLSDSSPYDQRFSSAHDRQIPGAKSDHGPRQFYDLDNEVPINPANRPPERD